MVEKEIIILTDGFITYEIERTIERISISLKNYVFSLSHYTAKNPNYVIIDENSFFESVIELNKYFNIKLAELIKKGFE